MAQISFGTILQDERERKGLDVSSVARRLRIRPDILQAIEDSDFSRMPPRGYARNMVNAYARYLGLNPTEITRMYLDEAYADQVKKARTNAQPTGFDMSGGSSRRGSSNRGASSYTDRDRDAVSSSNGRVLMVDSNTSRYRDLEAERYHQPERTHRSTQSAVPGTQYTNFYAGPQSNNAVRSKLPLIIAGGVILVLLIILLVFLFGPKGDAGEDVQKVPVTGVDNTTQTPNGEAEDNQTQPTQQQEPTKTSVTYTVADGQTAYIEVYVDDVQQEGGNVTGPVEKPFEVTGVIRLVISGYESVKVTQDGVDVPLTDEDGDGVAIVTISFPEVLDQWRANNPSATPTATDTGGAAGAEGTAGTEGSGTAGTTE